MASTHVDETDGHAPVSELQAAGRRILLLWCALSGLAIAALVGGFAVQGAAFFYSFQGPADASRVEVKFVVFVAAWCWLGAALAATQRPELLRRYWAILTIWLLTGMEYLNVVRGPHKVEHKDFSNYFTAATRMRAGLPSSDDPFQQYLYPPLLATLLEPMVPYGLGPASWAFRFLNYAGLLGLVLLLYAAMRRFGAGRLLAAGMTLTAVLVNVPLSDTLAAQQVNIHVANLVLGSLLLFPAHPAWSAALLAAGVHVKVYPVLLAVPFVWQRQWRWCAWFGATLLLIVAMTSAVNGFGYYLDFLHRVGALQEFGIRNASVASLLHNTLQLNGLSMGAAERPVATVLQLALLGLVVWWGAGAMRLGLAEVPGDITVKRIATAYAVLSIGMLVVSPSIWVHHFTLALLPAMLLGLWVRRTGDALALGVAYFLIFLVPVHEVYPFSYLRLAGLLALALLIRRAARDAQAGLVPLVRPWTDASLHDGAPSAPVRALVP